MKLQASASTQQLQFALCDLVNALTRQRLKRHNAINSPQEFGTYEAADFLLEVLAPIAALRFPKAKVGFLEGLDTQVAGHDHHRIAEVSQAALRIGQTPFAQ